MNPSRYTRKSQILYNTEYKIMKKVSILLISMFIFLMACQKTNPDSPNQNPIPMLGFDDLEVGDKFQYELFLADDYFDDNNSSYTILADTLVLEVEGITEDGKFIISERFTESSTIFNSGDIYYYGADSVYTNLWVVENNSLLLEEKDHNGFTSHLFLSSSPSLSLENFSGTEAEIFGWKARVVDSQGSGNLFIKNGIIGNNVYEHINVVVNNGAMVADGPGFTFFYNREDGMLRTSRYSAWTGAGVGWERISD